MNNEGISRALAFISGGEKGFMKDEKGFMMDFAAADAGDFLGGLTR